LKEFNIMATKSKKKPAKAKKQIKKVATRKKVVKAVKKQKLAAKKVLKNKTKTVVKKKVQKVPKKTTARVSKKTIKPVSKKEAKTERKNPVKSETETKTRLSLNEPKRRGRKPAPKPETEKSSQPRIFDVVYVPMEMKPKPAPTFIPMRQMPDVKLPEKKSQDASHNKTRYSDKELKEFKALIERKLHDARIELDNLQSSLLTLNEHGTDDTGSNFKMLEDGSETLAKEEASSLALRQKKYVEQLENALKRIENKTYGICRVTGKLIPRERLLAVPHTTQSIEAKMKQYGN